VCPKEHGTRFRSATYVKVFPVKRWLMILGVVLVLLGIAAVVHPTYSYHKEDQVAKIGPFQATVEEEKTAQVPVAATVALLTSGLVLVLLGSRMKS
jgi:uncharacterized membrane protein